ncbi:MULTISPECIES: hypothetical protein [unclassified Streptomyces]|uniref:hypothetical protein n=1 Tax=unclassified Streptomyces TaxID=2593676 RepID=UPI00359C106C
MALSQVVALIRTLIAGSDSRLPTRAKEVLFQGWKPDAETHAQCEATSPANGSVPDTEAIIRIPARMIPMIREACDAVERAQLR